MNRVEWQSIFLHSTRILGPVLIVAAAAYYSLRAARRPSPVRQHSRDSRVVTGLAWLSFLGLIGAALAVVVFGPAAAVPVSGQTSPISPLESPLTAEPTPEAPPPTATLPAEGEPAPTGTAVASPEGSPSQESVLPTPTSTSLPSVLLPLAGSGATESPVPAAGQQPGLGLSPRVWMYLGFVLLAIFLVVVLTVVLRFGGSIDG